MTAPITALTPTMNARNAEMAGRINIVFTQKRPLDSPKIQRSLLCEGIPCQSGSFVRPADAVPPRRSLNLHILIRDLRFNNHPTEEVWRGRRPLQTSSVVAHRGR